MRVVGPLANGRDAAAWAGLLSGISKSQVSRLLVDEKANSRPIGGG